MSVREIRTEDDEVLRKKSKEIPEITERVLELLDDMADTMYDAEGVGLAAPQIGILRRAIVIDIGDGLLELINPVILEVEGEQTDEEGCLSVPNKKGIVKRPLKCKVQGFNRDGDAIIVEGEELMARALCHEIDHLNGVLYIDKQEKEIDRQEDEVDN